MAFKMKGSPMQRNFGISPVKNVNKGKKIAEKNRKMAEENKPDTSIKESNYRTKIKTTEYGHKKQFDKSPKSRFKKPPAGGEKSKGTLRGVTQFESDFPKVNKAIKSYDKGVKKIIGGVKKNVKKGYDYFTKK